MYGDSVSVRKVGNGYLVRACDPEIRVRNRKDKEPYRDPEIEAVFETVDAALAYVGKAVKLLAAKDTYETAFTKALKQEAKNADG